MHRLRLLDDLAPRICDAAAVAHQGRKVEIDVLDPLQDEGIPVVFGRIDEKPRPGDFSDGAVQGAQHPDVTIELRPVRRPCSGREQQWEMPLPLYLLLQEEAV